MQIRGNQIRNGVISGEKIASGALDTGHISNNFVLGPSNINLESILDRHLYSGSIDGNKIRPQGINGSRLANYAVTKEKLAGGAVQPVALNKTTGLIYNSYLPDFGANDPYTQTFLGVSTESISIAFSSDKVTFAPYNSYTESIYLQKIMELSQNSGSKKIELSGSVEVSGSVLVNGSPIGSPDLSDYITSSQTSSFVINSQTSSFITSDQTGSFGSPQIIDTTYLNIETLISSSQLTPQQKYRITNYNSFAYINAASAYVYSMPEPIIVEAITTSSLSRIAISEKFPKDLIWYDINSSSFSDAVSPNFGGTNLSGSSVNKTGGIFRRYDPERNIDLPFDWRAKMALVVSQSAVIALTGSLYYQVGYPSITTASFGQFVTDPSDNRISLSITRHNINQLNSFQYISPFGFDGQFFRNSSTITSYGYQYIDAGGAAVSMTVPAIDGNSSNIFYDFSSVINPEGFFDEEGDGLYHPSAVVVPTNFLIRNSSEIEFKGSLGITNLNYVNKSTFRDYNHIMLYDSKNVKIGSRSTTTSIGTYGQYIFNGVKNIEIFEITNSKIFLESCYNISIEGKPTMLWLKKMFNSKFLTIGSIILSNTGYLGGYTYTSGNLTIDTMPWSTYALNSISIMGAIGHNEIIGADYNSINNDISVPWETDFHGNYFYNIHGLQISGSCYNNVVKSNNISDSIYIKYTGSFYANRIDANRFSLVHKIPSASWSAYFDSNNFSGGTYVFGTINAPMSQSIFQVQNNTFINSIIYPQTGRMELYNNTFYNTTFTNTSMSSINTSKFHDAYFNFANLPVITGTTIHGKASTNMFGSHFTASVILPNYNTWQKTISFTGSDYVISYLTNSGSFISTRSSTIP